MQIMAVVGNQPPKLATRGDVRALEEGFMFDDPRSDDTRDRDDWRERDATQCSQLMPLSERETLRVNIEGRALEKSGRIDEAIALHEYGVAGGTDTPFTYTRLRILYRRLKRPDDVDRIKRLMMEQWGRWW